MKKSEIHTRFKYAEEHAHNLDSSGNTTWKIYREQDLVVIEDGEKYDIPQYIVEWEE